MKVSFPQAFDDHLLLCPVSLLRRARHLRIGSSDAASLGGRFENMGKFLENTDVS